ncbi:flagellar motor protein MotD [Massilia sp. LXY-6]|uniref:flagellar motor protein MotD n=1 Tax=Massilia sp. LXY-6 TaxID=3379823 RepID=UPI003EDEF5E8
MARRKRFDDDSHENHERWLISYADFITLLFAFFVVMYAVSVVNVGKYKVLSDALGDAFGGRGAPNAGASVAPGKPDALPLSNIIAHKRLEAARRDRERLDLLARKLNSVLAPLVNAGRVRVTRTARGITVEINASVLFDEGDAALVGNARATLQAVAGLLKDDPHAIEVEGHTDTTPIRNAAFPSNWELSAVRASTVVRLFADNGVLEQRLAAVGRGANQPIASNGDPVGRARNRRVAVTILSGTE